MAKIGRLILLAVFLLPSDAARVKRRSAELAKDVVKKAEKEEAEETYKCGSIMDRTQACWANGKDWLIKEFKPCTSQCTTNFIGICNCPNSGESCTSSMSPNDPGLIGLNIPGYGCSSSVAVKVAKSTGKWQLFKQGEWVYPSELANSYTPWDNVMEIPDIADCNPASVKKFLDSVDKCDSSLIETETDKEEEIEGDFTTLTCQQKLFDEQGDMPYTMENLRSMTPGDRFTVMSNLKTCDDVGCPYTQEQLASITPGDRYTMLSKHAAWSKCGECCKKRSSLADIKMTELLNDKDAAEAEDKEGSDDTEGAEDKEETEETAADSDATADKDEADAKGEKSAKPNATSILQEEAEETYKCGSITDKTQACWANGENWIIKKFKPCTSQCKSGFISCSCPNSGESCTSAMAPNDPGLVGFNIPGYGCSGSVAVKVAKSTGKWQLFKNGEWVYPSKLANSYTPWDNVMEIADIADCKPSSVKKYLDSLDTC